jgi:hypothetical protein
MLECSIVREERHVLLGTFTVDDRYKDTPAQTQTQPPTTSHQSLDVPKPVLFEMEHNIASFSNPRLTKDG